MRFLFHWQVPTLLSCRIKILIGLLWLDGTTPVGISQSASSTGAAGASGAALGTVLLTSSGALAGMGASALVALSFAFFP